MEDRWTDRESTAGLDKDLFRTAASALCLGRWGRADGDREMWKSQRNPCLFSSELLQQCGVLLPSGVHYLPFSPQV